MFFPCCHDVSNVAVTMAIRVQVCEIRPEFRTDKSLYMDSIKDYNNTQLAQMLVSKSLSLIGKFILAMNTLQLNLVVISPFSA